MRKLIKLLAAAGMLAGLLAIAPQAQAAGNTAVTCVVNGSVSTNFSTYNFINTDMNCTGLFNGQADAAVYKVTATGNTQAIGGGDETCADGENNGSGYLKAELQTTQTGAAPALIESFDLTFTRVALAVEAEGSLSGTGFSGGFTAALAFAPTEPEQVEQCDAVTGATPATMDALLTGAAAIS